MKKLDVIQTIGAIANFGVIAGIVFLGLELRQTQVLARAQMRNDVVQQRIDIAQFDLAGPSMDLIFKFNSGAQIGPDDEFRLAVYSEMWLAHFENLYYQYSQGLYGDDGQIGDPAGYMGRIFTFPPIREFFCTWREGYSQNFVRYVEQRLGVGCE